MQMTNLISGGFTNTKPFDLSYLLNTTIADNLICMLDKKDLPSLCIVLKNHKIIKNAINNIVYFCDSKTLFCRYCKTLQKNLINMIPGNQCFNCAVKKHFKCDDCGVYLHLLNSMIDISVSYKNHVVCVNNIKEYDMSISYIQNKKYSVGIYCKNKCKGSICIHCDKKWKDCKCKTDIIIKEKSNINGFSYKTIATKYSGCATIFSNRYHKVLNVMDVYLDNFEYPLTL